VANFFRKLFGSRQQQGQGPRDNATTAPLNDAQIQTIIKSTAPRFEVQQLLTACSQSVGRQRDLNEDSILTITATLAGNGGNIPFGLFIVADGMGGHQYGEVASNAAARAVAGYVLRRFFPYLFSVPAEQISESLQEIMKAAIDEAQRVVQREAPGGGTTLTAALVLGQQVTFAHVGDSRAYAIGLDGHVDVITRDHSLVKRLEELGHITSEEATNYPHRNVLYKAIGQGDVLESEVFTRPFPQHSTLMLCSDGLWSVVAEKELVRAVNDGPTLQRACQNLVAAANAAGGPDNISVILVQYLG